MSDMTLFDQAGLPAIADFKAGLQQARAQAPASNAGVQYLKMNQVGSPAVGLLTYGAEQTEVQENSRWAVNAMGMQHGFLLRDGGSVNSEVYGPVHQPLPSGMRAPVGDEKWRQAYKCNLVCISGEDIGTVCEYAGDAGGVVKLFKTVLMPALEAQLDVDPTKLFPVVVFEVTSYTSNKQKKEIYEAKGALVDWVSNEDIAGIVGNVDTAAPAAAAVPAAGAGGVVDETAPGGLQGATAPAAEEPAPRPATRRRRSA